MSNLVVDKDNQLSVDGTSIGSAFVPYIADIRNENQIIKLDGDVTLDIDGFKIKATTLKELIMVMIQEHPEVGF